MRTVVFSMLVTNALCALLLTLLWVQNRRRCAGTGYWAADALLQSAAVLLILLRGVVPDVASMFLANIFVIAGAIFGLIGLEHFLRRRGPQFQNIVLLAAFAVVHLYFTVVQPDLTARNLNVSVGLLLVCLQCLWLVEFRADGSTRPMTRGVALVFLGLCLLNVVRIVEFFAMSHDEGPYFGSGLFEKAVLVCYQILFILLTYTLSLMVNRTLLGEIRTQEERASKVFRSSPCAIALTRMSDGRILEVNDAFLRVTGYSAAEVVGRSTVELAIWNHAEDRARMISDIMKNIHVRDRELTFRRKSGEIGTGLYSAEIITVDGQSCVLSSFNDITERKRAEERIRHMAQHDALTGLPNRALFNDLMEADLAAARRDRTPLAILFIDVDQLKPINDTLGHAAGDALLRTVADRLRRATRESDTVARVGGDEFVVMLRTVRHEQDALDVARKIVAAVREPAIVAGEAISPAISVGVAMYPAHGCNATQMMKSADDAMYLAKQKGGNGVVLSGRQDAAQ